MFKDHSEQIEDDVRLALEAYTLEDILEHNDITLEEALAILIQEGFIQLPDQKPLG